MSRAVTRSIRLTFKATDDEYFRLETDFNTIHHRLGGKDTETRRKVYEAGILVMLKQIAQTASEEASYAARRVAILEKTQEIRDRDGDWKLLESIFDNVPLEEFSQWCAEKNIDLAQFLEWRETKQTDSRGEDLQRWLSDTLRDGEPISTVAIKQKAISENIIEDTPQEWTYLRVIALRNGYVGRQRGYWQNGFHKSANRAQDDDTASF